MSLKSLEESLVRHSSVTATKAKRPMDHYTDTSAFGTENQYGGEYEESQLNHFRETYYSAARVIVHRLCNQPVFVARRGVKDTSRSLARLIDAGLMPAGDIPASIVDPSRVEVLDVHPFLRAWEDPNDWMSSFNMKEMLFGSLIAAGRGFLVAFPRRGANPKRRVELYSVPATWMKPSQDLKTWTLKPPWAEGNGIQVPDSQVCQLKFADPSNPLGALSRMTVLGKTVLTDEAIQTAQYNDFKNPMPKVALIAGDTTGESNFTEGAGTGVRPVRLTPEQRRNMVSWYRQQFAGVQKFGLPLILDAIIRDIKPISRTNAEMAFLESSQSIKERIYEGLGVSPMLNGALEKANRDSALVAERFFVNNTANPIVNLATSALTQKMGPMFADAKEDLIIWMQPLVAQDSDLDIALLKEGRLTYSMTRNEMRGVIRKRFGGLPRVEGWDTVVMPQTLDERDDETPSLGVGRDVDSVDDPEEA